MNDDTDLDLTGQLLLGVLMTEPTDEVETRLRSHLNRLQAGLAFTTERPKSLRKSRPRRATFRRIMIATSIAAAAFLMMVFSFGPVDALAQIAQSVAAKKWLHATGVGPHGQPVEFWYSPVHGILASSQGGTALFVDLVNRQMDVFGKPFSTDSIQRTKVDRSNDGGIVASQQSLLALLSGDLVTAMKSGNLRVLEHQVSSIEVAGQERSEHRFVIQSNENKQFRSETLLQVDPKSGLPVQWQIRSDGQLIGDFTLSYPELGPTTIFGLGVAAQTPISDTTPRGTFLELMTSNDAARNRFDDYHAVLIESASSDRGTNGAYYRIWKKGHRWRIDRGQRLLYKHEQPTADADPEQWWLQKTKSLRSLPLEIWDGKRFWNFEPQYVEPKTEDPTEPGALLIQSLKTMNGIPLDPDNPRMHFGGLVTLPEQFAYESLHQAASFGYYTKTRHEARENVMMAVLDVTRPYDRHPNVVSPDRYWFDPLHGNMIVLKERFLVSNPNQPKNVHQVIDARQSPQGLWYPATIRDGGVSVSMETGKGMDWYRRYYLEFGAEIPDELFDAESIDLNNFWTPSF